MYSIPDTKYTLHPYSHWYDYEYVLVNLLLLTYSVFSVLYSILQHIRTRTVHTRYDTVLVIRY